MSELVKVAVKDLHGAALDWAVAKCYGTEDNYLNRIKMYPSMTSGPSNTWEQGGPIIERKNISLCRPTGKYWFAWNDQIAGCDKQYGDTPLIAAMRYVVASELGSEIEVPKELEKYSLQKVIKQSVER